MTTDTLEYFRLLVQQESSTLLFEAALSLGQDAEPELDLTAPQMKLDALASTLQKRLPSDASSVQKLRTLNHFFYQELGFCGNANDYYHPDNSYLHRVISTRRGIPISLAMIYIEMAQQVGLHVRGISFPGHFLMKLSVKSGEIILDPFNGSSLSKEELEARLEPYLPTLGEGIELQLANFLRPASAQETLVRMLRNLKMVFLERHAWQRLLGVQQRLMILLPGDLAEQRDRGLTYAHLNCPQAALQDIEHYLARRPEAVDADVLRSKVVALRQAANKLN